MPASDALELAVVLPTYNERDNVASMVARLGQALEGIGWEAIFVDDDSTDGTADNGACNGTGCAACARAEELLVLIVRVSRGRTDKGKCSAGHEKFTHCRLLWKSILPFGSGNDEWAVLFPSS